MLKIKNCLPVLFSILFFVPQLLQAQNPTPEAPYKRFPDVPPVEILLTDSATIFKKADLDKKKPVLLVFFSPDCDHCIHETEAILANIQSLKNVQIVMASVLELHRIKGFAQKYNLSAYPNITVGRDKNFFLPGFFDASSVPVIALYDKKHRLVDAKEGGYPIDKIISLIGGK